MKIWWLLIKNISNKVKNCDQTIKKYKKVSPNETRKIHTYTSTCLKGLGLRGTT